MNHYHDKTQPQLIDEIESLKKRIEELEQAEFRYKQEEITIKTNEIKLRNIIEHSSNLFYSHTPDHLITYLSPQTREFFDCEPEEAKMRWTEFLTENPCNEIGLVSTGKAIETCKIQPSYELELVGKRGRKLWVEVSEAPIVENGKTVAIVGALIDITERKQAEKTMRESEERYRTLTEAAQDAIFIIDREDNIAFVNSFGAGLFGQAPIDLIGKSRSKMFPPELAEQQNQSLQQVFKSGESLQSDNKTVFGKNDVWLSTRLVPLKSDTGEVHAVLGISRDITERKTGRAAAKDSEYLLRESQKVASLGSYVLDMPGSIWKSSPISWMMYLVLIKTTIRIYLAG